MLQFGSVQLDADEALVSVSVAAITSYWEKHDWYQRSELVTSYTHDFPWEVEPFRMSSLFSAAKESIELPPIKLSLSTGKVKGVCFPDGRHRICVASILGSVAIPAIVRKREVEEILKFLN
jgi:hypothetical protein